MFVLSSPSEYDSSDLKENGTIPFYRRFFLIELTKFRNYQRGIQVQPLFDPNSLLLDFQFSPLPPPR